MIVLSENCWLSAIFLNASSSLSAMNISWKLTNLEQVIGSDQGRQVTLLFTYAVLVLSPVIRHLLDSDLGKTVNGGHPRPEDEAESLEQERERDMCRPLGEKHSVAIKNLGKVHL